MLNRDFDALTVTGALDTAEKNILAGSPVTLGENGYKLAKKGDVFAGLSVNYFCEFSDEVAGGDFHVDSGKISVTQIGQVTLDKDVYFDAAGLKKEVLPYDASKTYAAGELLFVDENGLITNNPEAKDKNNIVGRVVVPATATSSAMTIALNCLPDAA